MRGKLSRFLAALLATALLLVSLSSCSPGLPDKPPAATMSVGSRSAVLHNGDPSWRQVAAGDFVQWPPVYPNYPLFVQGGSEVTFAFAGVAKAPESLAIKLWYLDSTYEADSYGRPIHTSSVTEFTVKDSTVSFKWMVPDIDSDTDSSITYYLQLAGLWKQGGNGVEARYSGLLALANPDEAEAVAEIASEFTAAAWEGSLDKLKALTLPGFWWKEDASSNNDGFFNPFYLGLEAPTELVVWQQDGYSFGLASEPVVHLLSIGPERSGPWSQAIVTYDVEVTSENSRDNGKWTYSDNYVLRNQGDGWTVSSMLRTGTPVQYKGGSESGWEVEAKADGPATWVSTFSELNVYMGFAFSDDGRYLAFGAENFDRVEIWSVKVDGGDLRRLVSVGKDPNLQGAYSPYVQSLSWIPDQHKVAFALSGYQTDGPYAGRWGVWAGKADATNGKVEDLGFAEIRTGAWLRDASVSPDRANAYFRAGSDLYRIDLSEGPVTKIVGDLDSELLSLRYSPTGRYVSYGMYWEDPPRVVVYDLESGQKTGIPVSDVPDGCSAFFDRWGPGDLLCVSIADNDDVVHGEDSSWAAASLEYRMYDVSGNLVHTLACPTGKAGERIGAFTWSVDGHILAFAAGPTTVVPSLSYFAEFPVLEGKSLWTWDLPKAGETAEPKMLSALAGEVDEVAWAECDASLEVWYRIPETSDPGTRQEGLTVSLGGESNERSRPVAWLSSGMEHEIGKIGDHTYFTLNDENGPSVNRRGPGGETETLLEGPYNIDYSGLQGGSVWCVASERFFPSRARLFIYTPR